MWVVNEQPEAQTLNKAQQTELCPPLMDIWLFMTKSLYKPESGEQSVVCLIDVPAHSSNIHLTWLQIWLISGSQPFYLDSYKLSSLKENLVKAAAFYEL